MKTSCFSMCKFACVVCLLLMGCAGVCAARGNGIKAGEGRLHPGIDLDLSYDTNPGYFTSNAVGDLLLKIRPGLALMFPSDAVSFDLTGKVGYDLYFGIDNKATRDLSAIAGEASMHLGFNPNGQISFFIEDIFSRTGDPRYTSLSEKFNRTDNEAKARFQFKPGGGALMFDLAYGFFIDWFDKSSSMDTSALSSYAHRIYFSGKWKFLPKTAFTLDFDSDLRRYPNAYTNGTSNMDLNAIRATVGMLGQISPSMSLLVKAGYGDSLLPSRTGYSSSGFRSVIGQAELSYNPGTTLVQVGYLRNFQPVVLYVYFGQDRFYARLKQQLAGKFSIAADIGFDLMNYGTPIDATAGSRSDKFLSGDVSFSYHILDWLDTGLDYRFQALLSDYQQPVGGTNAGVAYNKHVFSLHIGIDY